MITDSVMRDKISKYYNLFDEVQKAPGSRLFRKMQNGKVTNQVIGVNTIAKVGSDIARYLGYSADEAKHYTSHCFRRTGVGMLAESGATILMLKLAGGWKSSTAAEGYVENSLNMKRKVANLFARELIEAPIIAPILLPEVVSGNVVSVFVFFPTFVVF
jgi:hypothetical protein